MKNMSPVIVLIAGSFFLSCKKNGGGDFLPNPQPTSYTYMFEQTPTWQDDFIATALNTNDWTLHAAGNRQDGYNDMTGVSFDGNNFVNKVYSDTVNGVITHHAAMIRTSQLFIYGKFEVRASFVNQSGSWSAFWLQSPTMGNPIGNPQAAGMEIDVVETLTKDGAAHQNLHWDGYGTDHKTTGFITGNLGVNGGSYHVYTLEWTPKYYKFYVDDVLTWTYSANVSQRSEFIILSSEVKNYTAGTWAGPIPSNGFGSLANANGIMKVDYVKWYKMK